MPDEYDKEKCEYQTCGKPATHVLVYWFKNQHGKLLPEPRHEVGSCLEHLVELANNAAMLPTWITDIPGLRKYPELLKKVESALAFKK